MTIDLHATRLWQEIHEQPAGVREWLSPIVAILPGQLFAVHLAHSRGYDPDHPRALRKVTETL